jgi:hypothetical protein
MLKCTAAWVSVENHVDRGNAGQWKARESDETTSLPFPPPLEIAAAISHIPTASTTTGYLFLPSPLCANMSETGSPSTITVGRGKKSHFDKHEQDKLFFRCVGSFGA